MEQQKLGLRWKLINIFRKENEKETIMIDKEYINRKEVLSIVTQWICPISEDASRAAKEMLKRIIELPSADVVEVVRCKDCEYCWQPEGSPPLCSMWPDPWNMSTDLDGYCHKAKRREYNNE